MKRLFDQLVGAGTTPLLGGGSTPRIAPLFGSGDEERAARVEAEVAEARTAAERAVAEKARVALEEIRNRYAASIARLDEAAGSVHRVLAEEVVSLALVVAEELAGAALRADRDQLLSLIETQLADIGDDEPVTVRLAPADAAFVREHLAVASVQLVDDASLRDGGCVISTPRRVVDATLPARIDAVRDALTSLVTAGLEERS